MYLIITVVLVKKIMIEFLLEKFHQIFKLQIWLMQQELELKLKEGK
jgi:hypothetical protein